MQRSLRISNRQKFFEGAKIIFKPTKFFSYAFIFIFIVGNFFAVPSHGEARDKKPEPEKILYIPHDNRPVVNKQTIEVVERAGYQVITPPPELLGNREDLGHPDRLWEWLENTTNNENKDIKAAVISSDSMIYGSLVGSRKHYYGTQLVLERTELFRNFRREHKDLPIYVFGSVMRTPRTGEASGYEEPDYYRNYGANIFRYTALIDKQELEGLTAREIKEKAFLEKLIPERAMTDWMSRRGKNFDANKKLIDMAQENTFNCLLLGRDDNAPFSQTHREGRNLQIYGNKIDPRRYQTIAGIDEVGLMVLARAINDLTNTTPTIFVSYNYGAGPEVIPSYSDEKIDKTINSEIVATGSKRVNDPARADFILAVNTNPNGITYEAAGSLNDWRDREGTNYFVNMVNNFVDDGRPVAVADIAFANGSDNALMDRLNGHDLLFKLHAYAAWNTPTNSVGFALSTGILANKMKLSDKRQVLLTRYIDDWGYQANVRKVVKAKVLGSRDKNLFDVLNEQKYFAAEECLDLMQNFAEKNLDKVNFDGSFRVDFTWNRMFESDISFKVRN